MFTLPVCTLTSQVNSKGREGWGAKLTKKGYSTILNAYIMSRSLQKKCGGGLSAALPLLVLTPTFGYNVTYYHIEVMILN